MTAAAWVSAWFATLCFGAAFLFGWRAATSDSDGSGAGVSAFFLGYAGFVLAVAAIRHAAPG